jgi:hypothetical protein
MWPTKVNQSQALPLLWGLLGAFILLGTFSLAPVQGMAFLCLSGFLPLCSGFAFGLYGFGLTALLQTGPLCLWLASHDAINLCLFTLCHMGLTGYMCAQSLRHKILKDQTFWYPESFLFTHFLLVMIGIIGILTITVGDFTNDLQPFLYRAVELLKNKKLLPNGLSEADIMDVMSAVLMSSAIVLYSILFWLTFIGAFYYTKHKNRNKRPCLSIQTLKPPHWILPLVALSVLCHYYACLPLEYSTAINSVAIMAFFVNGLAALHYMAHRQKWQAFHLMAIYFLCFCLQILLFCLIFVGILDYILRWREKSSIISSQS